MSSRYVSVFRPFAEARAFVRGLGLESKSGWYQWNALGFRPLDIPYHPHRTYLRSGWSGWQDWLGAESRLPLPFESARKIARGSRLTCAREWKIWSSSGRRPSFIPSSPDKVYVGQGWAGWGDWLGTGRRAHPHGVILPFRKAREEARRLGLSRIRSWQAWAKSSSRPMNIPSCPQLTYAGRGWAGWSDWLGRS